MPSGSMLKIKTDSQATIDSITYALTIKRDDKWLTINNRSLMVSICALVRKKRIILELIKVKVHANIESNKRADKLAEERIARNVDSLDVNRREVRGNYIRVT